MILSWPKFYHPLLVLIITQPINAVSVVVMNTITARGKVLLEVLIYKIEMSPQINFTNGNKNLGNCTDGIHASCIQGEG